MAKKSKKIEKETRRLIEGVSDLIKIKNEKIKFKSKNKKAVKKMLKNCPHWVIRKGKEMPSIMKDPKDETKFICMICKQRFPVKPLPGASTKEKPYKKKAEEMLEIVNQIMFWAIKLGGDKEDTKMFLRLKNDLPRFAKVAEAVASRMLKRAKYEDNRKKTALDQWGVYSGFNYRF